MLQTVFEGKMPQHFDCEELMESLLTTITEEDEQEVESLEKIFGSGLVDYYRKAYFQGGEEASTALKRYMEELSQIFRRPNPPDGPISTLLTL